MTKIVGMEEIQSAGHLQQEIAQGGKFVVFQYCISLLIITFKRSSNIYFISHADNAIVKGRTRSARPATRPTTSCCSPTSAPGPPAASATSSPVVPVVPVVRRRRGIWVISAPSPRLRRSGPAEAAR